MEKKKFATVVLDSKHETFNIYVTSLSSASLNIYSLCRPEISGLIPKKAFIKVFNEYIDFTNVFFLNLASKLLEHTEINDYAIKLVVNQQPPYGLIYSLEQVKLETLKAYNETNLAIGFIRSFKLPAGAPILFDWEPDGIL